MSQKWLSIVEYARAFNISDMTIRRRIKTGKLSATLKDGKYFIPVDEETLAHGTHPKEAPSTPPHTPVPGYPHHGYRRAPTTPPPSLASRVQNASTPYYPQTPHPTTTTTPPHPTPSPSPTPTPPSPTPTPSSPPSLNLSESTLQDFMGVCQRFMAQIQQQNQELKSSYAHKILGLEKTIELKEAKITELHQKIEDLQLLVEIFEGKKAPPTRPSSPHHPKLHS